MLAMLWVATKRVGKRRAGAKLDEGLKTREKQPSKCMKSKKLLAAEMSKQSMRCSPTLEN